MKVVVASHNPVKINSVQSAFETCLKQGIDIVGVTVDSYVSDQPKSDKETLQGAMNRAKNAAKLDSDANYFIGIEGGIQTNGNQLLAFAWIVITDGERFSKARTGSFCLPPKVAQLIAEGVGVRRC